ncbi:helix-turn-helix transcriptional regulator [Polaromonas hydrogenivorans]|uniref:AlpA family phage regulatory protein n=1 Tax=Polaromonas hydrogenivorans TaxID=335476 RepID=A0AAU7LYS4_9BURK
MTQQEIIIRRTKLPGILGISMATIDRLRAAGDFPKPIRLGEQAIGFTKHSIEEWLATRPTCHHFTETIAL